MTHSPGETAVPRLETARGLASEPRAKCNQQRKRRQRGGRLFKFRGVLVMIAPAFVLAPLVLLLGADPASDKPRPVVADLVVINARVWTVNKAQAEAEAVAVWRDRILAVGRNADVKPLIGPQ